MKPVAVIPMNDPAGVNFLLLQDVAEKLKQVFACAYVSVDVDTKQQQPKNMDWLKSDSFFVPLFHQTKMPVGEDFLALYQFAADDCESDQLLHLCFIDRVAFALLTDYCEAFLADSTDVMLKQTPLIFERSKFAWETHPKNYFEFEQMIRRSGEWLLGQSLDFAWCYMVITAGRLQSVIPRIRRNDISILAELVVLLREDLQAIEVDWLAWEDPFVLNRNAEELKQEREQSKAETLKRLAYVSGMLDVLQTAVISKGE